MKRNIATKYLYLEPAKTSTDTVLQRHKSFPPWAAYTPLITLTLRTPWLFFGLLMLKD